MNRRLPNDYLLPSGGFPGSAGASGGHVVLFPRPSGGGGRGDVTAILQPKILKEIDFAWVQQVGMLRGRYSNFDPIA